MFEYAILIVMVVLAIGFAWLWFIEQKEKAKEKRSASANRDSSYSALMKIVMRGWTRKVGRRWPHAVLGARQVFQDRVAGVTSSKVLKGKPVIPIVLRPYKPDAGTLGSGPTGGASTVR